MVYNGEMYLFFTNMWNYIVYRKTSDGTDWDDPVGIGPSENLKSGTGVGLAVYQNKLWVAYTTNNNDHNIYLTHMDNLGTWSTPVHLLNGAQSDQRPGLAAGDGKLVMIYKGESNHAIYRAWTTNGTTWFGNTFATGETKHGGPALVYTD